MITSVFSRLVSHTQNITHPSGPFDLYGRVSRRHTGVSAGRGRDAERLSRPGGKNTDSVDSEIEFQAKTKLNSNLA